MELSHLARRVGVTHRPSIEKAKEYQRVSAIKAGQGGAGKNGGSAEAQSVCCIELGCKFHQQPIDSALALKYSLCKTPTAYAKVLTSLQHALGLHALITTKELALQHGCIQANELAKRVLQTYKEAMSGGAGAGAASEATATAGAATAIPTPSIPAALLSTRSVYPCVAFYLSCRLLKLGGVDKKRLLQTAQCTEREFAAVIESFRSVMPELRPKEVVSDAAGAAAGGSKKRKKKSASDEADADRDGAAEDADADPLAESSPDLSGGVELAESAPVVRSSNGSGDDNEEEEESKQQQPAGKKRKTHNTIAAILSSAAAVETAAVTPAASTASAAASSVAASLPPRKKVNIRSSVSAAVFTSPAAFIATAATPSTTTA